MIPCQSASESDKLLAQKKNIFQHVCKAILANFVVSTQKFGRFNAIMVRVLYTGVIAQGSSLGWGHCVVVLGTLSASLHPGV